MRTAARQMPSRLRRLEDALYDLPLDESMLLSELDGFLTGILVGAEAIAPEEWLASVWGVDDTGLPPFDDPADVRWFADAVIAQHDSIARDLARGKLQPVFDVDERNGDVLWELWVDGFAQAMDLRPDGWAAPAADADAMARLSLLIAVARNESDLDSVAINALQDAAPTDLVETVLSLYATRPPRAAAPEPPRRIGRNDPCACGSGKKSKRCCGG